MKFCGVYEIKNLMNNKVYIGQSIDIDLRWKAECYRPPNKHIEHSFLKYGLENFSFKILKECPKSHLDDLERFFIRVYCSWKDEYGYNKTLGGDGGNTSKYKDYKKVICLDTEEVFENALTCISTLNLPRSHLYSVLRGDRLSCGKKHFMYFDEEINYKLELKRIQEEEEKRKEERYKKSSKTQLSKRTSNKKYRYKSKYNEDLR